MNQLKYIRSNFVETVTNIYLKINCFVNLIVMTTLIDISNAVGMKSSTGECAAHINIRPNEEQEFKLTDIPIFSAGLTSNDETTTLMSKIAKAEFAEIRFRQITDAETDLHDRLALVTRNVDKPVYNRFLCMDDDGNIREDSVNELEFGDIHIGDDKTLQFHTTDNIWSMDPGKHDAKDGSSTKFFIRNGPGNNLDNRRITMNSLGGKSNLGYTYIHNELQVQNDLIVDNKIISKYGTHIHRGKNEYYSTYMGSDNVLAFWHRIKKANRLDSDPDYSNKEDENDENTKIMTLTKDGMHINGNIGIFHTVDKDLSIEPNSITTTEQFLTEYDVKIVPTETNSVDVYRSRWKVGQTNVHTQPADTRSRDDISSKLIFKYANSYGDVDSYGSDTIGIQIGSDGTVEATKIITDELQILGQKTVFHELILIFRDILRNIGDTTEKTLEDLIGNVPLVTSTGTIGSLNPEPSKGYNSNEVSSAAYSPYPFCSQSDPKDWRNENRNYLATCLFQLEVIMGFIYPHIDINPSNNPSSTDSTTYKQLVYCRLTSSGNYKTRSGKPKIETIQTIEGYLRTMCAKIVDVINTNKDLNLCNELIQKTDITPESIYSLSDILRDGGKFADMSKYYNPATKIASITNSNIVQLTDTQILTNKTLESPTITGTLTTDNIHISNTNWLQFQWTNNKWAMYPNNVQNSNNRRFYISSENANGDYIKRLMFDSIDESTYIYNDLTVANKVKSNFIEFDNKQDPLLSYLVGFGIRMENITGKFWKISHGYDNSTITGVMGNALTFCFDSNNEPTDRKAYILHSATDTNLDFTGQHRCVTNTFDYSEDLVGYIVSTGTNYKHLNSISQNKINNIKISESLPFVNITTKSKDKKVFGVISDGEDQNESSRTYQQGVWGSVFPKKKDDNRIYINSVGEGAIWVSDFNGPIESGDYITSSDIPGIGQRQDAEMLMNYTVAKITMDCAFEPIIETSMTYNEETEQYQEEMNEQGNPVYLPEYNMKYIKLDGTIIQKAEYETLKSQEQSVYRMAFVGCTYHCG